MRLNVSIIQCAQIRFVVLKSAESESLYLTLGNKNELKFSSERQGTVHWTTGYVQLTVNTTFYPLLYLAKLLRQKFEVLFSQCKQTIFRILGSDEVVRNCFTHMTAMTPVTTLNT